MRRLRFLLAGAAVGLGPPGVATAQEPVAAAPVEITPGAVVTVVLPVPRPDPPVPDSAIRFRIEPASGVLFHTPPTGRAARLDDGSLVVPLTFGTRRDQPAGPLVAGHVELEWPGGRRRLPLVVRVRTLRRLALAVDDGAAVVVPGGATTLRYRIANLGNASDTIRLEVDPGAGWTADGPRSPRAIARGDTLAGELALIAPTGVTAGAEHIVILRIHGVDDARPARVAARVTVRDGGRDGRTRGDVSTAVFLGATGALDGAAAASYYALEVAGRVAPDVGLHLRYRPRLAGVAPRAFHDHLSSPGLRLALRHPRWSLAAGEVSTTLGGIASTYVHGTGAEARGSAGRATGALLVARPGTGLLDRREGHIVRAAGEIRTSRGRVGLELVDWVAAVPLIGSTERSQSMSVRLDAPPSGHGRVSAAIGVLRVVAATGAVTTGPTADASYAREYERTTVLARARWTPALPRAATGAGSQLLLATSTELRPALRAFGSAYLSSSPRHDGSPAAHGHGGTFGLSVHARGARLDVSARHQASRGYGFLGDDVRGSVLAADVLAPAGPVVVTGGLEVGRRRTDVADRPIRSVRVGGYWYGGRGGLAWTASHAALGFGEPVTRLDLDGRLRHDRLAIEGGVGIGLRERGVLTRDVTSWYGATYSPLPDVDLTLAVDYGRWRSVDPSWRLSAGIRKRFALPLAPDPGPRLRGLVFEDRNGNLRRDPEEPPIAGVRLHYGPLHVRTDAEGRFRIARDAPTGGPLRVDASSLPEGTLVPAPPAGGRGFVSIPVVRAASLTLLVFHDADRDAVRDRDERPVAGAGVTLVDASGRRRIAAAGSDGRIHFAALPPGRYTVSVVPSADEHRPERHETEVMLAPGEHLTVSIPGWDRTRPIRIGPASGGVPRGRLPGHAA